MIHYQNVMAKLKNSQLRDVEFVMANEHSVLA